MLIFTILHKKNLKEYKDLKLKNVYCQTVMYIMSKQNDLYYRNNFDTLQFAKNFLQFSLFHVFFLIFLRNDDV